MNDLISRKALLNDFRKTITEQSGTMDWLNMINRQPSVGDNRWIPVSERLPEEYGKYLATVKHLDGDCEVWEATYFKEEWAEMSNHPSWKVIAWRPLPEPWEGEEE